MDQFFSPTNPPKSVKDVWSVHYPGEEKWRVIVRDSKNVRYNAIFNVQTGDFEILQHADTVDLPQISFNMEEPDADQKPVCAGMWIPVDVWLARYSPDQLEKKYTVRESWAFWTTVFAVLLVAGAIVWLVAHTSPAIEPWSLLVIASIIGGIGTILWYWANRHFFALVAAIGSTLVGMISVAAVFICWIQSLP